MKAFAIFNPIHCFVHRLNNILKICFFQSERKKKKQQQQPNPSASTLNPDTTVDQNVVAPASIGESPANDSESDVSEQEEDQQESNLYGEDTWIRLQRRKSSEKIPAQKMLVEDIPADAKKALLLLKQAKKLVEYAKKVQA